MSTQNEIPGSPPASSVTKRLLLVTGSGRSGTSTVAGALNHLGMHVPRPVLKPNDSNPRGFFESTWPLRFHRRLMDDAGIAQTDARPEALALMQSSVTPEVRAELVSWLRRVADKADQSVVKDPRSAWVPDLWREAAAEADIDLSFVTMLRHPAEVVGSRSTHYTKSEERVGAWKFAVMNLAAWVNQNLNAERLTRGHHRAWLRYDDLLDDWRREMEKVRRMSGVEFNHSLERGVPHEVDSFIDPALQRHRLRFEDLDLPDSLCAIAEEIWSAGGVLADRNGQDADAEARFDAAAAAYAGLFRASAAIAGDETAARVRQAREHLTAKLSREADAAEPSADEAQSRPRREPGVRSRLRRWLPRPRR
ncbi:sulfotransferase family protein [Nocardioides jensenii]|uniref:sulfotransferase family protein n=1 Tax=Nocardioides jensenii TaxID=1843 RepID=UPI00082C2DF2|nr:sulfotransferase [Nocardioides jensenii]